MLQFAQSWSWVVKTLVAVCLAAPFSTLLIFFNKRYGVSGEAFYFAWLIGVVAAFVCFAGMSSSVGARDLVKSPVLFLIIMTAGILLGGMHSALVSQAVPAAPNPSLPSAILGINTPIAYLLACAASKIFPTNFPVIHFSWINFAGIIILMIGIVMVTHRSG